MHPSKVGALIYMIELFVYDIQINDEKNSLGISYVEFEI